MFARCVAGTSGRERRCRAIRSIFFWYCLACSIYTNNKSEPRLFSASFIFLFFREMIGCIRRSKRIRVCIVYVCEKLDKERTKIVRDSKRVCDVRVGATTENLRVLNINAERTCTRRTRPFLEGFSRGRCSEARAEHGRRVPNAAVYFIPLPSALLMTLPIGACGEGRNLEISVVRIRHSSGVFSPYSSSPPPRFYSLSASL